MLPSFCWKVYVNGHYVCNTAIPGDGFPDRAVGADHTTLPSEMATIVWNYEGEIIFHMPILVGVVKVSDRLI